MMTRQVGRGRNWWQTPVIQPLMACPTSVSSSWSGMQGWIWRRVILPLPSFSVEKEKEGKSMVEEVQLGPYLSFFLFLEEKEKESERPREPSTSDPFFNQRKVVPEVISLSRRKEKLRSNILPLIRSETWRVGQVVETFLSDSPTHFL